MLRHLPNAITLSRGLLAPVIGALEIQGHHAAAFWLFTTAMATDLFDGALARRWGSNRDIGRVLDPASDKVLGTLTWIALWSSGRAAPWMSLGFVARDLIFGVGWLFIARQGRPIRASRAGQVATSFEGTALGLLLWPYPTLGIHWASVGTWVGLTAAAWVIGSLAGYLLELRQPRRGQDTPSP